MLVSYPEVEAEFLGTVTQVGVGSDEPVNTVKMMDCVEVYEEELLEGMQTEESTGTQETDNTIKINYTFALVVISSIKIRTIRQTKVPT